MAIRALTEDDRGALAEFSCARLGQPWTEDVEDTIREHLADRVASGEVSAVGVFDEAGSLRGVAAWRIHGTVPRLCRGDIVAVAVGSQRKGYGRQLKQAMIDAARAAGAVAIASIVHPENVAMLRLNEKLGARVEYGNEDEPSCKCYIQL